MSWAGSLVHTRRARPREKKELLVYNSLSRSLFIAGGQTTRTAMTLWPRVLGPSHSQSVNNATNLYGRLFTQLFVYAAAPIVFFFFFFLPTRRGYLSGCTVRERVPTDWPSRPSWLINQPIEASWLSFFLPEPLIPLRFSLFALFLLLFYLLFFFVSSGCFVRHLKVFRRDRLAGPLSSDVVPFAYWYRTGDEFPSISGDAPRSTPANANPGDWLRPAALTRPSPLIGPWPSRSVLCRITILLFFFPSVGIVLVALLSFRSGVSSASARPCRHRRASQALHLSCSLLFW